MSELIRTIANLVKNKGLYTSGAKFEKNTTIYEFLRQSLNTGKTVLFMKVSYLSVRVFSEVSFSGKFCFCDTMALPKFWTANLVMTLFSITAGTHSKPKFR